MIKVADVMTRGVMSIEPDATLDRLADGLTREGIDGAPVQDPMGHVLGMVSKSDLVNKDRFVAHDGRSGDDLRAEDIMSPVIIAVKEKDPLIEAVERMVETGTHRVLVVDESEHPVGILTPMDVLRALAEGRIALARGPSGAVDRESGP